MVDSECKTKDQAHRFLVGSGVPSVRLRTGITQWGLVRLRFFLGEVRVGAVRDSN
jgi:hypothetical protein